MGIQVKHVTIIVIIVAMLKIECVPVSPCPRIFRYEFDGQDWNGIIKIYPKIYNRFHGMDRITINLSLVTNRHIPNLQNLNLMQLKKSLQETYQDIARRQPIQYRVSFPFRNNFPEVLKIQVNGVQVCRNFQIFFVISQIELRYTFFLPTAESEEEQFDDYDTDSSFQFDANSPDPAIEVPSVVTQRIDEEDDQQRKHPRWQKHLHATDSQCGIYDEELKFTQLISGGDTITPGTWPWLVAIYKKTTGASNLVFQCTGNLISNRIVLTAAHCFKADTESEPIAARTIVLAFGRHDIRDWTEKNAVLSDVSEIVVHPDYLSTKESTIFDADIAILVTKDFISYTTVIKPICLWPTSVDNKLSIIGINGTLVAWGQPFENLEKNVPRRLTLPVVRNNLCFPSDKSKNTRRVFCAGTEKRGYSPCNGDSGSALAIFVNGAWFLRGIVSAALGDPILNRCELNTYAIFTDIISFRSWIDSHM